MKWKDAVHRQRTELAQLLKDPMARLATLCQSVWGERDQLNHILAAGFVGVPHVTYLYALNPQGVQISDNVAAHHLVPDHFGLDRSSRPYMSKMPTDGFHLSDTYVSKSGRPSVTAFCAVFSHGVMIGYLGADFDLRDLPTGDIIRQESGVWRQVKGDPSIRDGLFEQSRAESLMDAQIDNTLAIIENLITERGMFQTVIHFSSSLATAWFIGDPFRYHILVPEALLDPDICLIYPSHPWPANVRIKPESIGPMLKSMKELRMMDPNIYLRTASINIFNSMVSLTFSCDGMHYLCCNEFLDRQSDFWGGMEYLTMEQQGASFGMVGGSGPFSVLWERRSPGRHAAFFSAKNQDRSRPSPSMGKQRPQQERQTALNVLVDALTLIHPTDLVDALTLIHPTDQPQTPNFSHV